MVVAVAGEARAAANTRSNVAWPSSKAGNSVSLQTAELAALLKQDDVDIAIRAGEYAIAAPLRATGQRIRILGETGATLVFMQLKGGGIIFYNAEAPHVENLSLKWGGEGKPSRSHYGSALLFSRCSSPRVVKVNVSRSPGAGILCDECTNSWVESCHVEWTGSDGIHFSNCSATTVRTCSSFYTGDDSIAVVDYAKKPQGTGFTIEYCTVGNSVARGISVVGGSQGRISNCEIGSTASNGLHIEQDTSYQTRRPRDVHIEGVSITGTGTVLPRAGNQYAINVLRATNITLRDIVVNNSTSVGLSIVDSEGIVAENLRIANTQNAGARLIRSRVNMTEISIADSAVELFVADACPELNVSGLSLRPLANNSREPVRLVGDQQGQVELSGIARSGIANSSRQLKALVR